MTHRVIVPKGLMGGSGLGAASWRCVTRAPAASLSRVRLSAPGQGLRELRRCAQVNNALCYLRRTVGNLPLTTSHPTLPGGSQGSSSGGSSGCKTSPSPKPTGVWGRAGAQAPSGRAGWGQVGRASSESVKLGCKLAGPAPGCGGAWLLAAWKSTFAPTDTGWRAGACQSWSTAPTGSGQLRTPGDFLPSPPRATSGLLWGKLGSGGASSAPGAHCPGFSLEETDAGPVFLCLWAHSWPDVVTCCTSRLLTAAEQPEQRGIAVSQLGKLRQEPRLQPAGSGARGQRHAGQLAAHSHKQTREHRAAELPGGSSPCSGRAQDPGEGRDGLET